MVTLSGLQHLLFNFGIVFIGIGITMIILGILDLLLPEKKDKPEATHA